MSDPARPAHFVKSQAKSAGATLPGSAGEAGHWERFSGQVAERIDGQTDELAQRGDTKAGHGGGPTSAGCGANTLGVGQ